jgi:ribose transport system permease protein
VAAWFLLEKSIYGRWISAIGQSQFAARMAGIPVDGTRFITYVLCATLAAVCGFLFASFSGGAALNMGAEYLLTSIAVVVIGGSAVAGGNSNVPGIWGASLFMFLVVSMLNTYGFGAGVRLILTGTIIIAVILVASGKFKSSR